MSSSSKPRVVRKHHPKKVYTRSNYRKALPQLLEDFQERCAYSLVHVRTTGESEMHVDHFNPRHKKRSPYENLFPAYGLCNEGKSDSWPTDAQIAAGIRFLNPCKENDYGEQIFENPNTHELVGINPAAAYHIDVLDLNNPTLIDRRRDRALWNAFLNRPAILRSCNSHDDQETMKLGMAVLESLKYAIPMIDPPPPGFAPSN